MQVEAEEVLPPEQYQPVTFPEQSDLHFVAPLVSPSSHASRPTYLESPHIDVHVVGGPTRQLNPASY